MILDKLVLSYSWHYLQAAKSFPSDNFYKRVSSTLFSYALHVSCLKVTITPILIIGLLTILHQCIVQLIHLLLLLLLSACLVMISCGSGRLIHLLRVVAAKA